MYRDRVGMIFLGDPVQIQGYLIDWAGVPVLLDERGILWFAYLQSQPKKLSFLSKLRLI
jgi:hypothetical protein